MSNNNSNGGDYSIDELINLTAPKYISKKSENPGKIINFEMSNNMLSLSYNNFKKIENEFNDDNDLENPKYKDISNVVKDLDKNPTEANYLKIISKIASVNHTRTPKEVCEEIAEWAAKNKLIEIINNKNKKDNIEMVDTCINAVGNICHHYPRSLVSKVFRYLESWKGENAFFTINDSILRAVLPYYLFQWDVKYNHDINASMKYSTYHDYCEKLLDAINSKNQELNLHQLDFLIWYYYSNDSIRLEIIRHIP